MALPVIDNLLADDPTIRIEIWCGQHVRAVFDWHPGVNEIIDIPSVPSLADLPGLARRLRQATTASFFVLDRSRLIAAACKLASVQVLGTVRAPRAVHEHETDSYLDTLVQAGVKAEIRSPALRFDECDVKSILRRLAISTERYVVLHPGGAQNPGASMPSKRWPVASWREVIDWLEARSLGVVLTGSQAEAGLCQTVAEDDRVTIAAGRLSLMESASVASSALAFAGPDTGLTHMAAASGTSTVAIFGPTNPRQYAPRGRRVVVLTAPGSAAVAGTDLRRQSAVRRPAISDVSPQQVIEALDACLAEARS